MTEPKELVVDKVRVAGLAIAAGAVGLGLRAWGRARDKAAQLVEDERRAKAKADWEAGAPERERRRLEEEERKRQAHEEFLAAGESKNWRYETSGQCHLERGKKKFPTELDARICTWVQHEKHGSSLQRAYRCDGSDNRDGDGCGAWHLTSKSVYS